MILKLLDFKHNIREFDIGDIDNIGRIEIKVLSGDEIATVIYKDYRIATFDSWPGERIHSFFDDEYEIYDCHNEDGNIMDDEEFKNRKDSCWRCW